MSEQAAREFVRRLDAVEERLSRLAGLPPPLGLTDADQPSGEQWEWGQVWAHIAEFPDYWIEQLRKVFGRRYTAWPPFGRTKADRNRIDAIERNRGVPALRLMERIRPQIDGVRSLLAGMTPDDWQMKVSHQTMGILNMDRVMEDFLVGHLEAHADQLDALSERS